MCNLRDCHFAKTSGRVKPKWPCPIAPPVAARLPRHSDASPGLLSVGPLGRAVLEICIVSGAAKAIEVISLPDPPPQFPLTHTIHINVFDLWAPRRLLSIALRRESLFERSSAICSKAFRLKANRLRHALTPVEDDRAKVLASRVTKICTIRDIRRPARTRTGWSSRHGGRCPRRVALELESWLTARRHSVTWTGSA